jgi:hypothetical protein
MTGRPGPAWGAAAWSLLALAAIGFQVGWLGGAGALRVLVAVAFVALAPGFGWVRLLGVADPLARWTLTAVLSLSLSLLVAFTMAVTGLWAPTGGLAVLAALGGVGGVAHLVRARRGASEGAAPEPSP